jgi:membrane-associated phospholipid phosphatase
VVLVFDKLLGIASFPSFHTITGLLMLYACRGHRVLTALALVYVPIMISSTPLVGGHYFADLVSGTALVIVSILALKWARSSPADRLAYAS